MPGDTISPEEDKNKTYTQEQMTNLLELQKEDLKDKAKDWVKEKAEIRAKELVPVLAETRANEIAKNYIELSSGAKKFEEDKEMILYLKEGAAIPASVTIQQAMIIKMTCDSMGISFVDGLKGMCFINGNLFIYGPVFLSQITKNGYTIKFITRTDKKVEVELTGPNGTQKGSFTKEQAVLAKLWKNVYEKHPITMLTYKAVRDAQKWLCPEVLGALALVEEADEYPASNAAKVDDQTNTKKLENKKDDLKNKYKNLIPNEKENESI